MSVYEVFKDFAGPIATIAASMTAAGVTTVFAIKQWKTSHIQAQIALDKLKLETFDDRMEVLSATRSLIRLVVNARSGEFPDLAKMQELQRAIDDGRFLFNNEIRDYLKKITDTCYDAVSFAPKTEGRKLTVEERDELLKRNEALKNLINDMRRLPDTLEKEIAPNFLRSNALLDDDGFELWIKSLNVRLLIKYGSICALLVFVFILFALAIGSGAGSKG